MVKKTGWWLALSSLAVSALLWSAPAGAEAEAEAEAPWEGCFVEYNICVSRAEIEPVDWIRDYSLQLCEGILNACLWDNGYYQ